MINEDYKLFLNEKFDRIFAENKEIKEDIKAIKEDINNLKLQDEKHYISCPNNKKIEKINDDLIEYKVIKKYPKYFITSLVLYGILFIVLFLSKFNII